jgi:thiol-disulfide isomerase/thioredoxin
MDSKIEIPESGWLYWQKYIFNRSLIICVRTLINIGLLSLLNSCDNSGQSKTDAQKKKDPASFLQEKTTAAFIEDTLQFTNFSHLVSFFQNKVDSFDKLRVIAYRKNKPNKPSGIDSSYYAYLRQRNNSIYKFMVTHRNHSESFDGLKYLLFDWELPVTLLDRLFHQYPDGLQNSKLGKWYFSLIEKRKTTETQSHFNLTILDYRFTDTEGKAVTLKEISSKYILLDFWASWCAPCRYENRVLAKEKDIIASNTDLSVVAISLDNNRAKWLKASVADSLNYLSLCDFKALESPITKELNITNIPYNVIITKDGKIIANNLWGNRLMEFIKSLPGQEAK